MTLDEAIQYTAARQDLRARSRASSIVDAARQALEARIAARGIEASGLSRRSVGGLLALLEGDSEALRSAGGRFRSERVSFEKGRTAGEGEVSRLAMRARALVEACGAGGTEYVQRIPLEPRVVNSVSVETVAGYRSFDIVHADALSVAADLHVISTHGNPSAAPSGQLYEALGKEGITVDVGRVFEIIEAERIWTCFQEVVGHPTVSHVLTARMVASRGLADPGTFFDSAMRGVFSSVSALEYLGYRFETIALPLIYGQRIVDFQAAVRSLLRHGLHWLKKSDDCSKVSFVVYDAADLAEWDRALDECLGRTYIGKADNLVLEAVVRETAHLLSKQIHGPFAAAAAALVQAIDRIDRISVEALCVFGRRLCEEIVSNVIRQRGLKHSVILMNNIETLRESGVAAPWTISYMHSLRIFGNETVHVRDTVNFVPRQLERLDVLAALMATQGLLVFWGTVSESDKPVDS